MFCLKRLRYITSKGEISGPMHEILVLIAFAQIPHLNTYADVTCKARGSLFSLSLHLHPYSVHVSSKASG